MTFKPSPEYEEKINQWVNNMLAFLKVPEDERTPYRVQVRAVYFDRPKLERLLRKIKEAYKPRRSGVTWPD